jgi:ribonuclease HI
MRNEISCGYGRPLTNYRPADDDDENSRKKIEAIELEMKRKLEAMFENNRKAHEQRKIKEANKILEKANKQLQRRNEKVIHDSIVVDASCMPNPGKMEYRGMLYKTGEIIFSSPVYEYGTVHIGEFLAIAEALMYCKNNNLNYPIYSDSIIGMIWIKNKMAKTQLLEFEWTEKLFSKIYDCEKWLKDNPYENEVRKWQTRWWGEIPADYGRKNVKTKWMGPSWNKQLYVRGKLYD